MLNRLRIPIVQAPMAGGPSTPALAAAVSAAGALGFVAAGYKTPDAMAADIAEVRSRTDAPFGVNVFAARPGPGDAGAVAAYAEPLAPWADAAGVALGTPRSDDDAFDAKLERLVADPVAVVSFVFACPPAEVVAALRDAGTSVWVTVTGV